MELAIDSMHMQPASSLHYCQNTVSLHIQGYFRQAEACKMEGIYLRKQGKLRDASTAFQRAVRGYIECYNRSRPKDVDLLCQAIKLAVDCSKFAITSYPGLLPPVVVACSTNTGEDLVKLIMCSDVLGVEWTCVTFLLYSFLSLKNITKTA